MKLTFVPADTTPEIAWMQVQAFRRMTPTRRMQLALQWSDALRGITADGVRSRHPDWSEEQIKLEAIRLSIGDKLFREVYGKENAGD